MHKIAILLKSSLSPSFIFESWFRRIIDSKIFSAFFSSLFLIVLDENKEI